MHAISKGRIGLAMAVALGFAAGGWADPPTRSNRGDPHVYRTRVFRLKNFDPEKAVELLEELLAEPLDVLGPAKDGPPFGRPNGLAGNSLFPGPGARVPQRGPVAAGGVRASALPDESPGPPTGSPPAAGRIPPGRSPPGSNDRQSTLRYRVMVDERTKNILMRAAEPDILVAAELMSLLDLPLDKTLPAHLVALRAFRLTEADPEKVAENLQGLGHRAKIVAVPSLDLVVASGPDAELKEIADAVKALDGGDTPDPEAKPTKPAGARKPLPEEEEDRRKP